MQLRYNYRLYPTPGQGAALARAFGCARTVFNDALRAREEARGAGLPYLSDAELSARLTAVKASAERAWLGEVSAVVLQQALADLSAAYRNFFASLTGIRKGPKVGPPRFRTRKERKQAIRFTANARFRVTAGGKLRLPKIGDVPVRWSRQLPSVPSSVTVVKDPAGISGSPISRCCRTAGRSPPPGSCAGRRRSCGAGSATCPASRTAAKPGQGQNQGGSCR